MTRIARSTTILLAALALASSNASAADTDWAQVASTLGRPMPAASPDGVYRFGLARSDFKVTVDGVAIKPALALSGWLAFMPMPGGTMVMGDLVLAQDEIGPVMKRLVEGGVEITAVHNHLLRAEPVAPIYMHVSAFGDAQRLASTFHDALMQAKIPPASPPATEKIALDTEALDAILGTKGVANSGVYQYTIARAEPVKESGNVVPPAMGSAHVINFQPTGDGKAAITGDFVLLADEVNLVQRELISKGIEVTALHSHMIKEEPRLFFVHFWANADAATLARTLRQALDRTKLKRP
ncbi:MAG: DUF1259 domain-containing protein [Reyranellaceae bacterium]